MLQKKDMNYKQNKLQIILILNLLFICYNCSQDGLKKDLKRPEETKVNEEIRSIENCDTVKDLIISEQIIIDENTPRIVNLNHGESFGMCSGYCYSEKRYSKSEIIEYRKSWNNIDPAIFDTISYSKKSWNMIIRLIDLEKFKKLPKRIGCPDCTDGGAEWIEIIMSDSSNYIVEFEYHAEIEGIMDLLKYLRQ